MYKSSGGKKYKGSSRDTSSGKYRTSGYSSDVTYRSDDDDDDSPRMYGNESPDYYPTGKRDYYSHQSVSKSSNYYPGKSQDYYTGKSEYYPGSSKADYYTGGKSDFYMGGKHKGKEQPAYKMNKYQTIVLKVQIHCDACIRKVKKAIAEIDGVESISVDVKQKKVSVTGYLDPKKVLKKVSKTGKHVEMVSSKDSINHMSNKAAMIMSDHHLSSMNMNNMNSSMSSMSKPYAIVESKSSRSHGNSHNMPYVMTPQVRSDVDYMFSDENVNNCSIM